MQSPYKVRQVEEDGLPVYVLEDALACSQTWVVPGLGFNAYRFSIERGGQEVAIIDPPPTLAELGARPSHYGLPVLFPFPGRMSSGRYAFAEGEYALAAAGGESTALHGFALYRPWEVVDSGSGSEGAWLTGRLESRAFAELAGQYPSSFRLDVTYRLRGRILGVDARAENVGREPLPVGYGLHPYLRAPIQHGASAGGCVIRVPVTRRWEVCCEPLGGRLLDLEEDLPGGVSLEGRAFDHVYTGVLLDGGVSRAVLNDTGSRLAVTVEAGPEFRNWVVYTPPRPAVSLEPWTCLPNALNLPDAGPDTGLVVLQPGEWKAWSVRLVVEDLF